MEMIYRGVALYFLTEKGNGYVPAHCDVRCACNDLMDKLEKDGWQVNHRYSQDKAFREVKKLLR